MRLAGARLPPGVRQVRAQVLEELRSALPLGLLVLRRRMHAQLRGAAACGQSREHNVLGPVVAWQAPCVQLKPA